MQTNDNILIKAFVLIGLAGGAYYIKNLMDAGNEIEVNPVAIGVPKIKNGSILITADVAVDNPTNTGLNLKTPFIKGYINGEVVGNSIPSDKEITIKANARTLVPINISIPLLNIPSIASALLNSKKAGVQLGVKVFYTVNGINATSYKEFEL